MLFRSTSSRVRGDVESGHVMMVDCFCLCSALTEGANQSPLTFLIREVLSGARG